MFRSNTRQDGTSIATTIPPEVARKLGLNAGDELYWFEDGQGGFRVILLGADTGEMLEASERFMERFKDRFKKLAE